MGTDADSGQEGEMKYVVLDGRKYDWSEVRRLRRQQIIEARRVRQLTLFELKEDTRPSSQRSADGRYTEPLLFEKSGR